MADYDRSGRDNRGQYQGERARREDTDYRSGGYGEYVERPRGGRDNDDRTVRGSGYADRNWAERTGDEVRSWVGDDDAERRRERDRQTIGRYPGEDRGERHYGEADRSRTDDGRSYRGSDDGRTVRGSGYGDRNWAERTGDEVRSWVGDDDAERRRERDRQQIGRYPGEDRGEKLSDNLRGRADYDRRYAEDREGYRGTTSQGSAGGSGSYGGRSGYGGDDGYRQSGSSSQTSFGGSSRGDDRSQGFGQSERFGRTQGDQHGYGGQVRSSQGDTGRSPNQSAYGSYGGEGRYDSGPRTDMAGPGAYSQSPTGGAFGQTGFQAARDTSSNYGQGNYARTSSFGEREVTNDRSNSDDRGFLSRAADEVRSWFGDETAEHRRERDQTREDAQDGFRGAGAGRSSEMSGASSHAHDPHYLEYRKQRADELDRDYAEYKRNRSSQFGQDFASWRTTRTPGAGATMGGNDMRGNDKGVCERQRVLSKDGEPIGAVDKVVGSDIKLTRKDSTDNKHHLIPLAWVDRVEGHDVHLTKPADEVRREWRDAPEQPQGQAGQLNSGLAGSLQKGQDTTTSAMSGSSATIGTTASGAV